MGVSPRRGSVEREQLPSHTARVVAALGWRVMITAALTIYTTSWCGCALDSNSALTASRIALTTSRHREHNRAAAEFVGSVNGGNAELFHGGFADGSTD